MNIFVTLLYQMFWRQKKMVCFTLSLLGLRLQQTCSLRWRSQRWWWQQWSMWLLLRLKNETALLTGVNNKKTVPFPHKVSPVKAGRNSHHI